MKKFLIASTLIFIALLVNTNKAFALESSTTNVTDPAIGVTRKDLLIQKELKLKEQRQANLELKSTSNASRAAEKQANALSKIKQKGQNMIDIRLKSLNNLIERVKNAKHITDADKTFLTTSIQNAIAGLTSLKSIIEQDTTVEQATAHVKQIVTDYRIFLIFEPKIRITAVIDSLQTLSASSANISGKLQTYVDKLKAEGKDTTGLQKLLDDINSRLKTIDTTLASDKALIDAVTVQSTNYKDTFVKVRKDLADMRAQFAKIRMDMAQMKNELNRLRIKKSNLTITPTIEPTITSTTSAQ